MRLESAATSCRKTDTVSLRAEPSDKLLYALPACTAPHSSTRTHACMHAHKNAKTHHKHRHTVPYRTALHRAAPQRTTPHTCTTAPPHCIYTLHLRTTSYTPYLSIVPTQRHMPWRTVFILRLAERVVHRHAACVCACVRETSVCVRMCVGMRACMSALMSRACDRTCGCIRAWMAWMRPWVLACVHLCVGVCTRVHPRARTPSLASLACLAWPGPARPGPA